MMVHNSIKGALVTAGLFAGTISFMNAATAMDGATTDPFCGPEVPKQSLSLNTIIPALYSSVSGKAGSQKNWPLLRKLFAKNAMITPVFHDKKGISIPSIKTVEEFIALNKVIFKEQDFFEQEVGRQTFTFGHMATIISHYQSRDKKGAKPYAQGINSFQLLNDGRRWCVISVTWDSDQPYHPIEKKSLR